MQITVDLKENTRRLICKHRGLLSAREIHCELLKEVKAAGYSQREFINNYAKPALKGYEDEIEQVKLWVKSNILFRDEQFVQNLHLDFVLEADQFFFSRNEFELEVVKPVQESINWELANHCRAIERGQEKKLAQLIAVTAGPISTNQLAIDAYVSNLLGQLMQDGIVTGKSIDSIIRKLSVSGTSLSNTLDTIERRLTDAGFMGPKKVSIETQVRLTDNNWYNNDLYARLMKPPNSRIHSNRWLLPIILLLAPVIICLTQCKMTTMVEVKCNECSKAITTTLADTINIQFWIILAIFISLFFLPHFSKRLKKPPLFLWTCYCLITIALILLSIIYGFQTDKLTKYDSDSANNPLDWFKFSEWIGFPNKQIKLNKQIGQSATNEAIVTSKLHLDTPKGNINNLHLVVIDRTMSGDDNKWLKKKSATYKESLIKILQKVPKLNKTHLTQKTDLRDLLAASILPDIFSKMDTSGKDYGSIFIHDGFTKSLIPAIDTILVRINNPQIKNEFAEKYFKTVKVNGLNKMQKVSARTDFAKIFTQLAKAVSNYPKQNHISNFVLHLYIVSDFYHEIYPPNNKQEIVYMEEVENAIVKFTDLPYWNKKQVLLIKQPLYDEVKGQAQVEQLIQIFDKVFDRNSHTVRLDLKNQISKEYPLLSEEHTSMINDSTHSIRFHYSEQSPKIIAFSNIRICAKYCDSSLQKKADTLHLTLSDNGLVKEENFFYYNYSFNNCDSVTQGNYSTRSAELCQTIFLNGVSTNAMLGLSFNKNHLAQIKAPLYLELYSRNTKERKKYMLEFCPLLPNATNYALLVIYSGLFLAICMCTLLPLHFWYIKEYVLSSPIKWVNLHLFFSFLPLVLSICFFTIPLINYIDTPSSTTLHEYLYKITLGILATILFGIIPWQYRYYYSKYLFHQHEHIYRSIRKSRCLFVKCLVRKNKYEPVYFHFSNWENILKNKRYK